MKSLLNKTFVALLISVLIVAMTYWVRTADVPVLSQLKTRINNLTYDALLKTKFHQYQSNQSPVVILDIDEKSLRQEGRWPWPRNKVATLVDKLVAAGAVTIAFDVVFSGEEKNIVNVIQQHLSDHPSGDDALQKKLTKIAPTFDYDATFAKSLQNSESVLGVVFYPQATVEASGALPSMIYEVPEGMRDNLVVVHMKSFLGNYPSLQQAASGGGFVTTIPDQDGLIRRSPLVLRYGDKLYPSLALEAVKRYLLADTIKLDLQQIGQSRVIEGLNLGHAHIPTDAVGRVLIPYRGKSGSYPYISATDVLHDKFDKQQVNNALVFVGTSAMALADFHATPVESAYPGVEAHANIANGLLTGNFPSVPAWADGVEVLAIVVIGGLCAILFPLIGPTALLIVALLALSSLAGGSFYLWQVNSLYVPVTLPLLMVLLLAGFNLFYGFIIESGRRKQMKQMFAQYVPPAHVDKLTNSSDNVGFEGDVKELTVLFADIRNFTSISEKMQAADVKELLNSYFTPMTEIIFNHGGTIDKYVGDMIMAFWGAPLADEKHAYHGIISALEMIEKTEALKQGFIDKGFPEVNIGIGLNSGMMTVGDMGSSFRRSYTVLGDAVNLGSRLEGLSKFYQVPIVVSETTRAGIEDIVFRRLDKVKVKGKQQAIDVYHPIGLRSNIAPEVEAELNQYEAALAHYYQQKWSLATAAFESLQQKHPNTYIYQLYLERIQSLQENPPGEHWDGSYTRTAK